MLGFGLAFGSIPFHLGDYRMCYIQTKPYATSELPGYLFMIIPVSMSILAITCLTISVVYYVFKTERQSRNISARQEQLTLTKRTMWQSLFFLGGFYVVWPVFFVSFLARPRPSNYWFYVLASLLCPSQGIFNAFVYFRRRNIVNVSYLLRVVNRKWKTRSTWRESMSLTVNGVNVLEKRRDSVENAKENEEIEARAADDGSSNFFVTLPSFPSKAEQYDGNCFKNKPVSGTSSLRSSDEFTYLS